MLAKKIVYMLIGSGSKPLAGYCEYKGDYIKLCESQLVHCKKNKISSIFTDSYKMFYMNTDNITYLIMTTADYPTDTAESCLQSLKKEFSHDLTGKNFSSLA